MKGPWGMNRIAKLGNKKEPRWSKAKDAERERIEGVISLCVRKEGVRYGY